MSELARRLRHRPGRPALWRAWLLAWLLCWGLAGTALAAPDGGRQVLDRGWAVLMDSEETLDPAQLTDAEVSSSFRPLPGAPSLGYVRGAAWLRLTLPPGDGAAGDRLLELQFPPIDEATLYWPGASGLLPGRTAGDMHPLAQRDFPHRNIVFRVPPASAEPQTFYLRVRGTNTQNFTVVLWEPQRFQAEMQTEQLLWGVVLAVHLVLILSNLWFFQATRNAPYGLFALFTSLSFLSVVSLEGFAWRHLLHTMPALNDALVVASWMLAMPAAFLFVLRFIGLVGPRGRAWARVLLAGLALFSVSMVLADQVLRAPWARPAFTAVHLLTVPLMAAILAVQTWRGSAAARLMLVAMLPMMLAVGARLGRNLGLLPPHPLFDHGYYIGLVVYLLVLNYAVSRGHQALREAADAAQARALALSQRNARELEARVAERTADIAAAMRQVEGSLALERSLRARQREFFATVSHELRTPLAVIDTSAQNLALAQPPLPEAAHGRVDKILAAAQRLAALLDRQFRDEPGTDEAPAAHPRTCAVADLLREATASARLLGDDHRLQIDAPADGESFECDPELTRLALANLVENAVKYTPAGTTVKVRARREGQRATDALLIEVVDDGPGIPPSARPRLFFAPWRGEAAAGVAGTGLGLMLAQRMVQAQGGTLELLDRDGGGTVARIRLPTGPAAAHPSSTIAANS
jgi:signal transduction histidine kinase